MVDSSKKTWLTKRCWVEINLDKLADNVRTIKKHLSGGAKLLAVVKADAYGHGESVLVPELANMEQVDWFGVSDLEEGLSIRRKKVDKPVLVFTPPMARYAKIISENNLTVTIPDLDYAIRINEQAREDGVVIEAHIKLDTGMNRLGIQVEGELLDKNINDIIEIYSLNNINITGIYTHFATADSGEEPSDSYRKYQFKNFTVALNRLQNMGIELGIKHCANSAAIVCDTDYHLDMVRAGIIMYGNSPGTRCDDILQLHSTMEMFTRINQVKMVSAGTKIGYGITYTAEHDSKIAVIGFGYADGYPRIISNKALMLVNGKIAKNVGRVCMDQLMLDVTGIDAKPEDIVTVIGKDGDNEITWDWLAKSVGTINYEMMCLVGKRVFRLYIKNGEIAEGFSYMNRID